MTPSPRGVIEPAEPALAVRTIVRRTLPVAVAVCLAVSASAQELFFEDFDDGAHDLALYGGAGHTVGGGVSNQSYTIESDGTGLALAMRLDLLSLASDESSSVGSYVWPAARVLIPSLADASFVVSAEFRVDEALAEGPNQGLSVGLAARCSYLYNADNCVSFDANLATRFYRLSFALAGEGSFTDRGAPLAALDLRLIEYGGDDQVDVTVPGIVVPVGTPFTMSLEGTREGDALALVGRMRSGANEAVVTATDPTPLVGPGFGARTGGSVKGFGGADAAGALEVQLDDLRVAPEPASAPATFAAWISLRALRRRRRVGGECGANQSVCEPRDRSRWLRPGSDR